MNLQTRDARFWLMSGGVAAFVMLVAGWLLVISPQRDAAASLRSEAADGQVANAATASKIAALARLNQDPSLLATGLREALAALPSDSGLPEFTRQVTAQATAHDLSLSSIVVGGITAPSPDADTSGTTPTDGTDPADTSTAGTSGSVLPAGIVSIPITLISDGSAADQLAFLHAIRVVGPRVGLVTATQLSVPPTTGKASIEPDCTMTVSITVFSAVRDKAQQAEYAKLLQG